MALARVLLGYPSLAYDPEVQNALNKLRKDRCGDICELISQGYEDLMAKAKILQISEGPLTAQDSTQDDNSMIVHSDLTEADDTSSGGMLHLEIMVEDAMKAAI